MQPLIWYMHKLNSTRAIIKEDDLTCSFVNKYNTSVEQCEFVRTNETCNYDGVIYSYTELTYCQLNHLRWIAILVLILILLVLFVSIGTVADDFLCPSLLSMSKTLRLPDNIAGVTFLAFGNGAPDIFSSIGGISHSKPDLIFSSLYGGGIFVTTVVTGSVLISGNFSVMKRPVMRDIFFYIGAAFLVWFFIYTGIIKIAHSISLVAYYIFYICILIISRLIYIRMNSSKNSDKIEENNTIEENATTTATITSGAIATLENSTMVAPVAPPSVASGSRSGKSEEFDLNTDSNRTISDVEYEKKSNYSNANVSSRKTSIISYASGQSFHHPHYSHSADMQRRKVSFDEDVVLTRFYRRGTLHTTRHRTRSSEQHKHHHHVAHHHLSNTIFHIAKVYEIERNRAGTMVVDDVRYKCDVIESEKHRQQNQTPVKRGYVNEITFTNNFGRPKYLQQLSTFSTTSLLSGQSFTAAISETKDFIVHICPIDIFEWSNYGLLRKVMELVKAIPYLLMTICIPVVDLESEKENWCRMLICLNMFCAPQVTLFLLQINYYIDGKFPLWAVFLLISTLVSLVIVFTTKQHHPPIYHRMFAFVGFAVSVVFINTIAGEVIAILQTFGIIFKLSNSILGLTILAWGNSLGDFISDISMARHGYPGMAISACFGGPMLNMLMGLGIPYTVLFVGGDSVEINVYNSHMITLLYSTLTLSLCTSLLMFIFHRFNSSRMHGFVLIGIYLLYITLALLIEFNVIGKH